MVCFNIIPYPRPLLHLHRGASDIQSFFGLSEAAIHQNRSDASGDYPYATQKEAKKYADPDKLVTFVDSFNSAPLGTKIGIALILRFLAVGIIFGGLRLTSHPSMWEARSTGWLIVIIGMFGASGFIDFIITIQAH